MAEIKKKYFGDLKGKFGDAVFRTRGSKNFISRRGKFHKPETEEFRNRTDTFKMSSKLASLINSNKYLKIIWQNKLGKGAPVYPNMISINYSSFSGASIIGTPLLVPDNGIGVKLDNILIDDDNLTLKLKPLTEASAIDTSVAKTILSLPFVFLSDPVNAAAYPVHIIPLCSSKLTFNLEDPVTFVNPISTADSDKIKEYRVKTVFTTLITFDAQNNIAGYAKTFSSAPA